MGRPSKLSPAQWDEVKKRKLAGESYGELAKEFGVNKATIIKKLKDGLVTVKTVANQIVTAENELRKLPLSDQLLTLSLVDELRAVSKHLAGAAKFGAATAHRLAGIGNALVEQIDDADPLQSMASVKAVAVLTDVANKAAVVGLNLLNANKGQMPIEPPAVPEALPEDVMDAAAVYARLMG